MKFKVSLKCKCNDAKSLGVKAIPLYTSSRHYTATLFCIRNGRRGVFLETVPV